MFDIFLRILEIHSNFVLSKELLSRNDLFLPCEELNRSCRVTGGDTHNNLIEEGVRANVSFKNRNISK